MTKHLIKLAFLALAACKPEAAPPPDPVAMTPAAVVHYCQMSLLEHPGPKAQVVLEGMPTLFFSQVRDAIAYTRAPEQMAPILAVYVNDMGRAGATWERPGDGNWIPAATAFYVVGSVRQGGMGAPETVPFSTRESAQAFALTEGGRILALTDITDDMVLAPVETGTDQGDEDDSDFDGRLRALPNKAGG